MKIIFNMTPNQKIMIKALDSITLAWTSFDKRFVRSLSSKLESDYEVSEKQDKALSNLFHKYRKQIKAKYKDYDLWIAKIINKQEIINYEIEHKK